MKWKKVWQIIPMLILNAIVLMGFAAASAILGHPVLALIEFGITAVLIVVVLIKIRGIQAGIRSMISKTVESLGAADRQSLMNFPLPVIVTAKSGEVLWYNDLFRDNVIMGRDIFGEDIKSVAKNLNVSAFEKAGTAVDAVVRNHRYTVYGNAARQGFTILYWVENTELKNIVDEYRESRPVVAIVMIDNYDELMQNAREGEKAEIVNNIEKALVCWVSETTGFLRHSDRDKYLFVMEERHYRTIVESRFNILDKVRQIVSGGRMPATLSIGVGRGAKTLADAEEMARQALDMALGRGGDQAAVSTPNGFEFYGGVTMAVEKRTKVKTRIIASALAELIDGSGNVLIMGHKNSDIDSLGASVALYKAIMSRGKDARIVLNRKTSLAGQFISYLQNNGYGDAFIQPDDSLALVTPHTLLLIVDTHRKSFVEFPDLYHAVRTVVIIDHHRKMVDFIDNAVIFFHEPYASSTSEMVAELMQYLGDNVITSVEACALLAGMSLDTRNFTVRTGVRTFEAAGYLRRKGADTAKVRQLFSGTMEGYKKRAALVAAADIHRGCAISTYSGGFEPDLKIIAPQAADDLLTISGIAASFVLYPVENGIAISARSMGDVNVQLVMETLGGGGHLTMAGVQLPDVSVAQAKAKVKDAIDKYYEMNK